MYGAICFYGKWMSLGNYRLQIAWSVVQIMCHQFVCSGGLPRDEQFVPFLDVFHGFDVELRHGDIFEEIGTLASKDFGACSA